MDVSRSGPSSAFLAKLGATPVARRSCAAASVTAMRGKLNTLRDLQHGLRASRREFEAATKWEDAMNAGLMATRWVKASCDAFISMTATALDGMSNGKAQQAKVVSSLYTITSAVVVAKTNGSGGDDVGAVLFREVKDGAVGLAGKQLGPASGVVNLYTNIGINSLRGDTDAVVVGATAEQLSELIKLTKDWAEQLDRTGNARVARALASAVDIMTDAYKFEKELQKAGDAYLEEQQAIDTRRRTIRRTLEKQLAHLDRKIAHLTAEIDTCFLPADPAQRRS